MKNIYTLIGVCFLFFSCEQKHSPKIAKIEFEKTELNLGKIKQNETAECYFLVKNSGSDTLIFNQIIPNCDCTYPAAHNTLEILAGKIDTLKFVIDTYGKDLGEFESNIIIITNTIPDFHKLRIIAEIE